MEDEGCIGCRVWDGGRGVLRMWGVGWRMWGVGWRMGGAQDVGCKAQSVGCSPRAARPQAEGVFGVQVAQG